MSTHPPSPAPESAAPTERARCLNCEAPLGGPFCARCGQADRPAAEPLGDWIRHLFQDIFSLDSRLLQTLRLLLFAPGEATRRYVRGQRQPQTPPLRLYIGVSAVAIALMSVTGLVEFDGLFRDLSPQQVDEIVGAFGVEDFRDPAFRATFDRRFNLVFPLLNLLTPLGLVLSLKLVIPRTLAQVHGVAALHLSSTMVLIGIPPLLLSYVSQALVWLSIAVAVVLLAFATWRTLARLHPARTGLMFFRWVAVMFTYFVLGNAISLATMAVVFLSV